MFVEHPTCLHVAGLIHLVVTSKHTFVTSEVHITHNMLSNSRAAHQHHTFTDIIVALNYDFAELGPQGAAEALLKGLGQSASVGLEETIMSTIRGLISQGRYAMLERDYGSMCMWHVMHMFGVESRS